MDSQIVMRKVAELKPYKNNPRKNDKAVDAVAASIKAFGFKQPIVIDVNDEVIAGDTRLKAAKKNGLDEVPCVVASDLTPEQVKAYRLADNKVGELAEWDWDLLAGEMHDLATVDMMQFGFELPKDEPETVEDEYEEELPNDSITNPGDIWQLGRHRLMCGDATSADSVQVLTGGTQMDMLLTDPPYNVAYTGKTSDALTIANDKQDADAFRAFLTDAFQAANGAMKPGAVFYIWHADSEGLNFRAACSAAGFTVRQCLIWCKNTMVLGRQDYQWKHEPCLYGWKDGAGHLWASDRKQTTILTFDRPLKNKEHPTMKPVKLFDYQIKNNTKGGDCVLDLFGGSGTTLIACEQNGRNAYVMELDPKYCDVIIHRWEKLTGEKAKRIS
jgi:site-specific DNA-methyltransferase (adenine-specific)